MASLAKSVTELLSLDGVCVFDGGLRMVLVKLGLTSGGFCPNFDHYDRALNVLRASIVQRCAEHEQKVYASSESEAQKMMLISFVLIRSERNGGEEMRAGKVLLLFPCSMKGKNNEGELPFLLYMNCKAPLDEVVEAMKCLCLQ